MTDWRDRLRAEYLDHYSEINSFALRQDLPQGLRAEYELAFGSLLSREPEKKRILDLGCGTGTLVAWLNSHDNVSAVGVDTSCSQIDAARRLWPESEFIEADGLKFLATNCGVFDGIICNDVIEHIDTMDETFELLSSALYALKDGGFFFCRVPNAASLIGTHSLYADLTHQRLYTSHTLCQILRIAGFDDAAIAPIRSRHWSGRARLLIEHVLHKTVFWIAGRTFETEFTRNICAIGFRTRRA